MCGIVASPSLATATQIATELRSRGTRAWSLTTINMDTFTPTDSQASAITFEATSVRPPTSPNSAPLYVYHLQSPTAEQYRFHPAVLTVNGTEHQLWHNGMMDSSEHARFGRVWDTRLLLELLISRAGEPNFERLNEFQGSFACYYLQVGVGFYVFRNRIAPQYWDEQLHSYMSIKTPLSQPIEPGIVYNMKDQTTVASFENNYNPFGV